MSQELLELYPRIPLMHIHPLFSTLPSLARLAALPAAAPEGRLSLDPAGTAFIFNSGHHRLRHSQTYGSQVQTDGGREGSSGRERELAPGSGLLIPEAEMPACLRDEIGAMLPS